MDEHASPGGADPFRRAQVVRVVMRQEHGHHVLEGAPDRPQECGELLRVNGQAGIDDRQVRPVLEDIPGRVIVAEAVDAVGHLVRGRRDEHVVSHGMTSACPPRHARSGGPEWEV